MDDAQWLEKLRVCFNAGDKLQYFFWGHKPGGGGASCSIKAKLNKKKEESYECSTYIEGDAKNKRHQ